MNREAARYLRWLWGHHPWALGGILLLTLVSTATLTTLPLLLGRAFDELAAGDPGAWRTARLFALVAAAELVLTSCLMFARGTLNDRFQWLARTRGFAALVRQGPAFLRRFRTGDLVTRLTDDAGDKLSWFACSGVFRAVAAACIVAFALVHVVRLDPVLALVSLLPAPFLVLLHVRTGGELTARHRDVQGRISVMNDGLEACFSGVRVVKAYGREAAEEAAFDEAAGRVREAEVGVARVQALMEALHGNAWQLAVAGVLLVGGLAVIEGRTSLGTLVAFQSYVIMLVFPMLDLGNFVVRGRQSGACIERLVDLERQPPAVVEPADPARIPLGPIALAFEGVAVAHGEGEARREILRDVSFSVAPGELVALVGRLGSGKTSLLDLVPRLADPAAGRITLGGVDLRSLATGALRRRVGVAFQHRTLFSGTVRENVRFWRDSVTDEDIAWAVEVARLSDDVAAFAEGMDTTVGVRGITLSGGQGQRVALARALAGRPDVLVLDDVTSALDAETEAALWDELSRALPSAATLVVTHRLATLERADRVIVLDGGRIVEQGTHDELWRPGTAYRAIYLAPQGGR